MILIWRVGCALVMIRSGLCILSHNTANVSHRHHPPDFFIIGAAKCGTTSLHKLLLTHDEICNIGTKELHYFDRPKEYHKGHESYFHHFSIHCSHYFIDSTPDYLSHHNTVPLEIARTYSPEDLKTKKFIVILRDPVYRAYSWYNHLMKHCVSSMAEYMQQLNNEMPAMGWDTSELCEDNHCTSLQCRSRAQYAKLYHEVDSLATFAQYYESGNIDLPKGHYIVQLRTWLKYVPRSQFFIVNLSDLLERTGDIMHRMTTFLGLKTPFSDQVVMPHENVATVETEFDCNTRRELYKHFDPFTKALMDFMHENTSSSTAANQKPLMEPYFSPFKEYRC